MRRVVLLSQDSELTRILYHRLSREIRIYAVLLESRVSPVAILRRRLRRLGVVRAAGQLAFQLLVQRPLALASRSRIRSILTEADAYAEPFPEDVVCRVDSFNSESGRRAIIAARPGVIVVHGTRILSQRTIDAAGVPMLNLHAGITPAYRGVHGGYWALAEGAREECGVTVHRVDAGIDTGEPVAQTVIRPTAGDNFATYPYLQLQAGADLLAAVLQGRPAPAPIPTSRPSRLRRHPTLLQYVSTGLRRQVW